ncbi:hypothetical protein D3C81_1704130 [compost metagenome]
MGAGCAVERLKQQLGHVGIFQVQPTLQFRMELAEGSQLHTPFSALQIDGGRAARVVILRRIAFIAHAVRKAQIVKHSFQRTLEVEEIHRLLFHIPLLGCPAAAQQKAQHRLFTRLAGQLLFVREEDIPDLEQRQITLAAVRIVAGNVQQLGNQTGAQNAALLAHRHRQLHR